MVRADRDKGRSHCSSVVFNGLRWGERQRTPAGEFNPPVVEYVTVFEDNFDGDQHRPKPLERHHR